MQRAHALGRPIPIACVLTIAAGAAAGLHHAHTRNGFDGRPLGIVHRDVSPSNLMISYEGGVKVVDFGVAKASHRSVETESGAIKGKISYLSPEQCRAVELDRRSDLFSLGIVIWELLTTERLFKRPSDFENMTAIATEPVPMPSSLRPEVPPQLDALVARLLAKSPADRFQSGEELLEAIEAVAVQTGSALSTGSVGRFVRELFGQRPEPWIEMRSREHHSGAVTVTSEPIPAELATGSGSAAELAQQLGGVPSIAAIASGVAIDVATLRRPLVDPHDLTAARPTTPFPRAEPSTSGAHVFSSPTPHGYPVMRGRPGPPEPVAPARRSWTTLLVLGGIAAAIGVIVALVYGGGGGDHEAVAPSDARAVVASHEVTADAALAAAIATPDAEAADATIAAPDAGEAAPLDARAAAEPAEAAWHKPEDRGKPKPPSIAQLLVAGRYSEAVAACAGSPAVVAQSATLCILAACHVRDAIHATRWLSTVGSRRASVLAACEGTGFRFAPPKPDCKLDPMACPH